MRAGLTRFASRCLCPLLMRKHARRERTLLGLGDNPLPLRTALGIRSYEPVEGESCSAKPPFNHKNTHLPELQDVGLIGRGTQSVLFEFSHHSGLAR